MGFIDAFVFAQNQHHRRDIENPGNFGDCMKGGIRFMTAIISAYAHAYQVTCPTRHMPAVLRLNFRLPKPNARYPLLPTFVPQHVKEAMISEDGPSILTGVVALWMVKLLLVGVPSLDLLMEENVMFGPVKGRIDIIFGPVITTEAHLAFAGARTHSNNTAEMSAMIEALFFLGPLGPAARDANSCICYDSKHAAGVCWGTIQARTHVQLALACQQSMLKVQHRLRLTLQHVYGHTGNLGYECADDAAARGCTRPGVKS